MNRIQLHDVLADFWGAHAPRVLAKAPSPSRTFLRDLAHGIVGQSEMAQSSLRRGAATSTRGRVRSPTSRTRKRNSVQKTANPLFDGYSASKKPLAGYAVLVGVFTIALSSAVALTSADEDGDSTELGWGDLLLLGVAAHKLSRIVTKDLVTSPFRAPFVKFKKSAGAGEVEEEARGEGLQEAVGDLITCPYCMAPWVASALVFAHTCAPRATRMICSIFALTAASDFLNQLYARVKS